MAETSLARFEYQISGRFFAPLALHSRHAS
jgi:hypothetical protein